MRPSVFVLVIVLVIGCAAPPEKKAEKPPAPPPAPKFHRAISTHSAECQSLFDRGLLLVYSFDHGAAIAAFESATAADPQCAAAWWGLALAHGPHLNAMAMDEEHSQAAWTAIEEARRLAAGASPIERELTRALWRRYSKEPPANRAALDESYALAMREVWERHGDDPDAGTLFAEALMDLHPWKLWTPAGEPTSDDTGEIVATLERVLQLQPFNPGANHFLIHALEASPHPERAVAAADRLRTLVPDAAHLLHMASHIDTRLGHWALAADTNERAIAVDDRVEPLVAPTDHYHLYAAHDHRVLAYAAMMEGRSAKALEGARGMVACFRPELVEESGPSAVDGYLSIVLHVLVRFGEWEAVLREPEPAESFIASRAVWHYARGVSFAALGKLDEAEAEEKHFATFRHHMDDRKIGNNPAKDVLEVAAKTIAGEIAFRRGKTDEALALLRDGVALEDKLDYGEPPSVMQPVRHTLAATLLAAKRPAEAEKVLREDLERHPENGWALSGLARALRAQKKETADVEARLAKAWARADVKAGSPCLCQPGE